LPCRTLLTKQSVFLREQNRHQATAFIVEFDKNIDLINVEEQLLVCRKYTSLAEVEKI